jgi:hypothetical protein
VVWEVLEEAGEIEINFKDQIGAGLLILTPAQRRDLLERVRQIKLDNKWM